MTKASSYARAGVNIDAMMEALDDVQERIQSTATSGVVRGVGSIVVNNPWPAFYQAERSQNIETYHFHNK